MAKKRLRTSRAEAIRQLEEMYASLPDIECKGLCHDSCTQIDASELERERLRQRGIEIGPYSSHRMVKDLIARGKTPRCPALGPLNTCKAYDVRPLICRAFGMVLDHRTGEGMMCEHGCVPDGTIAPTELYRALLAVEELSEEVTGISRSPTQHGSAAP